MNTNQGTTHLPSLFTSLLEEQYDAAHVQLILDGCKVQRATTLRANTLKATRAEVEAALDKSGVQWSPVEWYADAFVLPPDSERIVWNLPLYESGGVYLQSLSSMIPALVLNAQAGDDVCDMCAAPGGKTTQIAALSNGRVYVTACEMHAPRADKLQHNLEKLGARGVTVLRTDARRLDDFFSFDRILVDAPCSGSGTLHADDPKVAKRFTPKLIEKSVKTQRALLSKALSLLKPSGTLVYSTCSILQRENEDAVRWALDNTRKGESFDLESIEIAHSEMLPLLPTTIDGTLALCPTDLYEGFFIAKIVRKR